MNFALCFHIICQKTVERLWLSVEQDVTDRSQVRMFIYLLFFVPHYRWLHNTIITGNHQDTSRHKINIHTPLLSYEMYYKQDFVFFKDLISVWKLQFAHVWLPFTKPYMENYTVHMQKRKEEKMAKQSHWRESLLSDGVTLTVVLLHVAKSNYPLTYHDTIFPSRKFNFTFLFYHLINQSSNKR